MAKEATKKSSNNQKTPPNAAPRRVITEKERQIYRSLPFVKRKMDFGTWVYKNKYGVLFLAAIFIALFFFFVTMKVELMEVNLTNGFMIEVPADEQEKIEEEEPPTEQEKKMELLKEQYFEDVKNQAANRDADLNGGLEDDRGTKADDLYKEAEALQAKLDASKAAYQKGLDEDAAIRAGAKKPDQQQGKNKEKAQSSNVKGNVTVSYSLGGRRAVYLPIPAYKCEGGGQVVVTIEVNPNGDVTHASVDKSSSQGNSCMNRTAEEFAKQSRFEVGHSWGDKQRGTITYIFLSQN